MAAPSVVATVARMGLEGHVAELMRLAPQVHGAAAHFWNQRVS